MRSWQMPSEHKKKRRQIFIMAAVMIPSAAIIGWSIGWWTAPTLEDDIRKAQIELLKDVLDRIADEQKE